MKRISKNIDSATATKTTRNQSNSDETDKNKLASSPNSAPHRRVTSSFHPHEPATVQSPVVNGALFQWNTNKLNDNPYLFIAHDNPQLSNTLKKSMGIMLESKDDRDMTYFILGSVAYNGSIEVNRLVPNMHYF